jgi:hypothetical protein
LYLFKEGNPGLEREMWFVRFVIGEQKLSSTWTLESSQSQGPTNIIYCYININILCMHAPSGLYLGVAEQAADFSRLKCGVIHIQSNPMGWLDHVIGIAMMSFELVGTI